MRMPFDRFVLLSHGNAGSFETKANNREGAWYRRLLISRVGSSKGGHGRSQVAQRSAKVTESRKIAGNRRGTEADELTERSDQPWIFSAAVFDLACQVSVADSGRAGGLEEDAAGRDDDAIGASKQDAIPGHLSR
jgi:hypothetical protein